MPDPAASQVQPVIVQEDGASATALTPSDRGPGLERQEQRPLRKHSTQLSLPVAGMDPVGRVPWGECASGPPRYA